MVINMTNDRIADRIDLGGGFEICVADEEGVWTLTLYHEDEWVGEIPLWGERPTIPREPDCYQIRGYAVLEGTVKPHGNSAHVTVPRKHLGKRVKVVTLEP